MQRIVKVALVTGCRSAASGSCGENVVVGSDDITTVLTKKRSESADMTSHVIPFGFINRMNKFDINPVPASARFRLFEFRRLLSGRPDPLVRGPPRFLLQRGLPASMRETETPFPCF